MGKFGRPKMINHEDPIKSFAGKLETGLQLFGAAKGIWDVGRNVVAAGRVVAPYIATAARTLAAI